MQIAVDEEDACGDSLNAFIKLFRATEIPSTNIRSDDASNKSVVRDHSIASSCPRISDDSPDETPVKTAAAIQSSVPPSSAADTSNFPSLDAEGAVPPALPSSLPPAADYDPSIWDFLSANDDVDVVTEAAQEQPETVSSLHSTSSCASSKTATTGERRREETAPVVDRSVEQAQAVREIVETEMSYGSDLAVIKNVRQKNYVFFGPIYIGLSTQPIIV